MNRVVPPDQLLARTLELARAICANGPLAIRASKRLLAESFRHGADWDDEIWQLNERVAAEVLASDDGREGALAFAQKRPPVWTGH